MQPPIKDQTNIGVDAPGLDASDGALILNVDGEELAINKDMARQEFAQEADLNYMLSRFGITPERNAPTYGEWDDTLDLQSALTSVAEARMAFAGLPPELREKFGSMEELMRAYNNGSFVIKDEDAPAPVKTDVELLQERINELQKRLDSTPVNP